MKKGIIILKIYLVMFALLFVLSSYGYHSGSSIFSLNMPVGMTNVGIMAISFLGILKTFWHIITY